MDLFRPVYNWFSRTLQMIAPDTRFQAFEQFIDEGSPLHEVMNEVLYALDTGISRLGGEEVPFGSELFTDELRNATVTKIQSGKSVRLGTLRGNRYILSRKGNNVTAKKLVAYHRKWDGGEERFELGEESDGTQRLIDLLPLFIDLAQPKADKVYVIDELDCSLHSVLTRHLLESYLDQCGPDRRTQVLFTTHDVLLMDQDLLRRDEMWITERKPEGNTTLIPFSDFKDIRYDKDIRKSYLQGKMGGIPRFLIQDVTNGRVGEGS
ncbi:MAG: ATP-binding protein [Clostridiaceae bacterium]|nr:ATP-binding protein [Clostridiaceae bacterium]